METHAQASSDRIQKAVLLHAPLDRVWRAISDSKELGSWFGMKLDGPLSPGTKVKGTIVPTTVDPQVAAQQRPYEGRTFDLTVDRVEPEHLVSFRWHPFAIDTNVDYSAEPTTLVSFELEDKRDGIMLTVTESGFDRLPDARRDDAFKANEEGWAKQMELVEKYIGES